MFRSLTFAHTVDLVKFYYGIKKRIHFQEKVQVEMSKTFCCLCCATPSLTVNYSLPVRGYVPGQTMPIKVNVENLSGVTVETVKLILCKVYTV